MTRYAQWIYEKGSYPITTIADLLEAQRLTWRNYVEDLPANYIEEATSNYPTIPPDVDPFAIAARGTPSLPAAGHADVSPAT